MKDLKNKLNEIRERLADLEHQQWAHWTKYMLNNLTEENIQRWRKQIETEYKDLTEKEKDSDREWAQKVIDTLHITPIMDGNPNITEEVWTADLQVSTEKPTTTKDCQASFEVEKKELYSNKKCPDCGVDLSVITKFAHDDGNMYCKFCHMKREHGDENNAKEEKSSNN